jgi:EPS-associated MarR family transcriptional regulator
MPCNSIGIAVAFLLLSQSKFKAIFILMTSRRAKLQEDTNFRLMQLLHDNPHMSQREMAKALGISFGGANYCLNALIEKGLVKIHNFSQNQNKFGYVYLLTPSGISEKAMLTSSFLKRKLQEYEALKAEIKALELEIGTENGEKSLNT